MPAWLLAGATWKLAEATPKALPPSSIVEPAISLGLDLHVVLAVVISLEFALAALMIFVARLSRAVAIALLSTFVVILVHEGLSGLGRCGCFGTRSPPIPVMLAIDGALLALAVFLRRPAEAPPLARPSRLEVGGAVALSLLGTALAVATVGRYTSATRTTVHVQEDSPGVRVTGVRTVTVTAAAGSTAWIPDEPPPSYAPRAVEAWVGLPWRSIDLMRLLPQPPCEIDRGRRHVVFFSRTCDHCKALIDTLRTTPLDAPLTLVEVPASRDSAAGPGAWEMPRRLREGGAFEDAERMALPLECDWFITTPLCLTFEDGACVCAEEGDHRRCLRVP